MESDPTKRFSDRVDNYVKYRPGYPAEVLNYLKERCGLSAQSIIADVGAGTGIFTKLLLDEGHKVNAVEPNDAMRNAMVEYLSNYKNFTAINGTANGTTLPANNIDLIVCAQAFHWFANGETREEFKRILKPGAKAALIWNNRRVIGDDFSVAYDSLLKNDSVDYNKVNHQDVNDIDFKAFFKDGEYTLAKFPNEQIFDEEGLIGRAFSSSYVPPQDSESGNAFLIQLKEIFKEFNYNGKVIFSYETEIYTGEV